jgi:hypothetical protein
MTAKKPKPPLKGKKPKRPRKPSGSKGNAWRRYVASNAPIPW